jgi:hypothetical protein
MRCIVYHRIILGMLVALICHMLDIPILSYPQMNPSSVEDLFVLDSLAQILRCMPMESSNWNLPLKNLKMIEGYSAAYPIPLERNRYRQSHHPSPLQASLAAVVAQYHLLQL